MWRSTVRSDDPLPPPVAHAPPPVMAASDGPGHSVPGRIAPRGADMSEPIAPLAQAPWRSRPGALVHDRHATPALRALADSCESEYPWLAVDLRDIIEGTDR